MSVRDFATHLGVNDAAVSSWEKRGEKAQLRYETQQLLDVALASAPEAVQERLILLLNPEPQPDRDDASAVAAARTSDGPGALTSLGSRSAERTKALLAVTRGMSRIRGHTDADALRAVRSFTVSSARTFALKGPAGSGKSHFTHDAAAELADTVDFQLHSVDTWNLAELDLAAEILRYASLPAGDDPLLTLERAGELLTRQCLVIIDSIDAPERLDPIGRQLDAIVRQVATRNLRFMLVLHTPPETDLTAFPVLAASIYEVPAGPAGTSYTTAAWDAATARETWNRSRDGDDDPAFNDLPASLQTLARLPLYMNLIKAAGGQHAPGRLNAYRLVDHCVTSILGVGKQDSARIARELAELAYAQSSQLVPAQLRAASIHSGPSTWITERLPATSALVYLTDAGELVFTHDIIRDYFLAKRIAGLIAERGRSSVTVTALNELAVQATGSATARGIFEFVVFALDDHSPELATSIALASTVAVESTLPMMLTLAASGTRFATDEVLRISANRRSNDTGIELARSLLKHSALGPALGDGYESWLLSLLRQFGSAIWSDVSNHIEDRFEFEVATRFLAHLNLDAAEEATFLARYYFLFIESDIARDELLEDLAGHMDWRVRMALAQGLLQEGHASANLVRQITDRLVGDADYKVRAAVARALGHNGLDVVRSHLAELLSDSNWHVRACVLDGTYIRQLTEPEVALTSDALDIVRGDPSWQTCPAYIAKLLERLHLLENASNSSGNKDAREHALFGLLRELRTGWINVPPRTWDALVGEGLRSPSWLVQKEAAVLLDRDQGANIGPSEALNLRQTFRRLRGSRSIQIALDLRDLDHAIEVATAAAAAGADLIEVGDPLIKALGIRAVDRIKRSVPETTVVAEMMSVDWGRDQVELAAEAGADVVLLIGPTTTASVSAAVDAGRRLGVAIVLDIPAAQTTQLWIREMERAGVDGFTVTTNIDLGVGVHPPLTKARAVRGWTRLPVAVSGGFSATDYGIINSPDWDIMIVGRGVAEAIQPAQAALEIVKLAHQRRVRPTSDRFAP